MHDNISHRITIDIETVPPPGREAEIDLIRSELQTGKRKLATRKRKPEEIKKEIQAVCDDEKALNEIWKKMSFDPIRGKLVCVAVRLEDGMNDPEDILLQSLKEFVDFCNDKLPRNQTLWIGHNVKMFDLPFLYTKMVFAGLKCPSFPAPSYKFNRQIFDTMDFWSQLVPKEQKGKDAICSMLGIKSEYDDAIHGGQVSACYEKEDFQSIFTHCMSCVSKESQLYRRLLVNYV